MTNIRKLAEKLRGRPLSDISTAADRTERAKQLVIAIKRVQARRFKAGCRRPWTRRIWQAIELREPITIQRLWELEDLRDELKAKEAAERKL